MIKNKEYQRMMGHLPDTPACMWQHYQKAERVFEKWVMKVLRNLLKRISFTAKWVRKYFKKENEETNTQTNWSQNVKPNIKKTLISAREK